MHNSIFLNEQEAFNFLDVFARASQLRSLCSIVLDDPRFKIWSGSSKSFQHHYGNHGLVIHTAEVAKICISNNLLYKGTPNEINESKLFLAALFHDAGKMWDYIQNSGDPDSVAERPWIGTSHKRKIHHISRSNMVWCETAAKHAIDEELKDEISHALLAHHGQRAWGSPVSPNSRLAWMLHLCDGISARMNDADRWDQVA